MGLRITVAIATFVVARTRFVSLQYKKMSSDNVKVMVMIAINAAFGDCILY